MKKLNEEQIEEVTGGGVSGSWNPNNKTSVDFWDEVKIACD